MRLRCGVEKVVSGGQTGVDRAALDLCLQHGIPCGGWCPLGRLAEDGPIHAKYPLVETATPVYAERTECNARDSDGTLIIAFGELEGGTLLTQECAERHGKPFFVTDASMPCPIAEFKEWCEKFRIRVLNIAGPRESLIPGTVYSRTTEHLRTLLELNQSEATSAS